MGRSQGCARLNDQNIVLRRYRANPVQPLQGEENLALRNLTADQTGIAALHCDRRACLGTPADHLCHILGRPRP